MTLELRLAASGGYAPPLPNFQTGIASFLALSARLSWMPVPGNTMTPIGSTSSIAWFRLNGAALACPDFYVLGCSKEIYASQKLL
jgi:hypothetical protein